MVNVFLSEPSLTGPLAVLGENEFTLSRGGDLQAHSWSCYSQVWALPRGSPLAPRSCPGLREDS